MTGNFTLVSAIPLGVAFTDSVSFGSAVIVAALGVLGFWMKMRDNRVTYLRADVDELRKDLANEKALRSKSELALAQALAVPIDLSGLVDTIKTNHSEAIILMKDQTVAIRAHESGAVIRSRETLKAIRNVRPSP